MAGIIISLLFVAVLIFLLVFLIVVLSENHKKENRKFKADRGDCIVCHQANSLRLRQTKLVGIILVYNYHTFNSYVCKRHAIEFLKAYELQTALKGWWSIYGFIRTPLILLQNLSYYHIHQKAYAKAD